MIAFWSRWARARRVVAVKQRKVMPMLCQRGMVLYSYNFTQLEARVVGHYAK